LKKVLVKYSVFACLIMFAIFLGCGVKGNPAILKNVPDNTQIVRNLKTVASDNSVLLKWDIYANDFKNNYIAIEKSELGSAGNECKDCPRTYERIGQVSLNEKKKDRTEYSSFVFFDKKVSRGKTYNYRLLFCDESDVCSESAIAEINFK
jgi:hypothetical protein